MGEAASVFLSFLGCKSAFWKVAAFLSQDKDVNPSAPHRQADTRAVSRSLDGDGGGGQTLAHAGIAALASESSSSPMSIGAKRDNCAKITVVESTDG
jgi:hypothetical protein